MSQLVIDGLDNLGHAVKELRLSNNLKIIPAETQTGVSMATISLMEHGKIHPRLSTLVQYAQALGVDEIVIKLHQK